MILVDFDDSVPRFRGLHCLVLRQNDLGLTVINLMGATNKASRVNYRQSRASEKNNENSKKFMNKVFDLFQKKYQQRVCKFT